MKTLPFLIFAIASFFIVAAIHYLCKNVLSGKQIKWGSTTIIIIIAVTIGEFVYRATDSFIKVGMIYLIGVILIAAIHLTINIRTK